jgi:phosphoenolpyruvate carboxykinase (GTP)
MSSETTAAAAGAVGQLRFDPFAMLPFCGYNMGDYIAHWLEIGESADPDKLPKLFWVNWFRRDEDGSFLWPGFGDNSRALKWIIQRVEGRGEAVETPIGHVPAPGALDTSGLDLDEATLAKLLEVDPEAWRQEVPVIEEHYASLGERLPDELRDELRELDKRLAN